MKSFARIRVARIYTGRIRAGNLHVEVGAGIVAAREGEVRSALQLRDAGDLPACSDTAKEAMRVQGVPNVDRINDVEQVPAVCRLDTVIATEIKRVNGDGTVILSVGV